MDRATYNEGRGVLDELGVCVYHLLPTTGSSKIYYFGCMIRVNYRLLGLLISGYGGGRRYREEQTPFLARHSYYVVTVVVSL